MDPQAFQRAGRGCEELRSWLGAYVDQELASADARKVARHLECCAACRREVAALEALERALRAHYASDAPAPGWLDALPGEFLERFDLASARRGWRPARARSGLGWWRRILGH